MGVANSSITSPKSNVSTIDYENGEHYQYIINPGKYKSKSNKTQTNENKKPLFEINPHSKVIKRLSFELIWNNLLVGNYSSFALSIQETKELLKQSLDDTCESTASDLQDIESYISFIQEIHTYSITTTAKNNDLAIDIMSIISSALLLCDLNIEEKIEKLFYWITLDPQKDYFQFDEFYNALVSFDKGISYALGYSNCSEAYIRTISQSWMALADPKYKGSIDSNTRICYDDFLDFCINRQHIVRRLLEIFSNSAIAVSKSIQTVESDDIITKISKTTEATTTVDLPLAGDEWLANPAWKKTADKMTPINAVNDNTVPNTSLSLEYAHGYRGFDCRNNIFYLSPNGSHILFHTAAILVAESTDGSMRQSFFTYHTDDIISLAVTGINTGNVLIASGEVGAIPVIHISKWFHNHNTSYFEAVTVIKGFHKKGICQLCFSNDSKKLFSVSIEYAVAIYNVDVTNSNASQLGKMVFSCEGPQDKIMHITTCFPSSNDQSTTNTAGIGYPGIENDFITCGEKHVIFWKYTDAKRAYQQIQCKLGQYKSKTILCCTSILGRTLVVGTADGDLLCIQQKIDDLILLPNPNKSALTNCHEHGVNCLWSGNSGSHLISSGKGNKVIIWQVIVNASEGSNPQAGLLQMLITINLNDYTTKFGSYFVLSSIRAVSTSIDNNRIVIGTSNCEIIEFYPKSNPKPGGKGLIDASITTTDIACQLLLCSHFKDELWGLDVCPKSSYFATVGE